MYNEERHQLNLAYPSLPLGETHILMQGQQAITMTMVRYIYSKILNDNAVGVQTQVAGCLGTRGYPNY